MDRARIRPAQALAGTVAVLVVVPWLAVALIGRSILEPDLDRPAWWISLALVADAVVVAAGILIVGALGWRARTRLVGGLYILAGAICLSIPAVGLVAFGSYPAVWESSLGLLGGAMLVTGTASLAASRLAWTGDRGRSRLGWLSGPNVGIVVALLGATAVLAVDMGCTYVVAQWQLSDPFAAWPAWSADATRGLVTTIGTVIDASAVLLIGVLSIRSPSLIVGVAYILTGAFLLALPTAVTVLEIWPPWWLIVVPAASGVEAAMVLAGLVTIGLALRDRRGGAPAEPPTEDELGEGQVSEASPAR